MKKKIFLSVFGVLAFIFLISCPLYFTGEMTASEYWSLFIIMLLAVVFLSVIGLFVFSASLAIYNTEGDGKTGDDKKPLREIHIPNTRGFYGNWEYYNYL